MNIFSSSKEACNYNEFLNLYKVPVILQKHKMKKYNTSYPCKGMNQNLGRGVASVLLSEQGVQGVQLKVCFCTCFC